MAIVGTVVFLATLGIADCLAIADTPENLVTVDTVACQGIVGILVRVCLATPVTVALVLADTLDIVATVV